MNIIVTKDNVKIAEQDLVHKGEYNVNPLIFSFSEEYEGISKMAVFSTPLKVYETAIVSNSCIIPHEVLTQKGVLKIGVYGYTLDNGVVNKRYSPTPIQIPINDGSYIKGASDPQAENPTEFEEFMQQLEDDIDSINDDINVLGQSVEDLQENKQDKIDGDNKLPSDLVSDTNQTNKFVTAEEKTTWNNKSDFSGDYNDLTNKPTIPTKVSELQNDSNYQTYEDVEDMISALGSVFVLKGSVNTVADLPMQDNKLGDVYYVKSESAGYVWIEDEGIERWEELGLTIDTSDFLTKSGLAQTTGVATDNAMSQAGVTNALNTKQNVIDSSNKLSADLVDDTNTTNQFVTAQEKTTWNNKSDFSGSYTDLSNKPDLTIYEEKSNKVTSINEDSTDSQYPSAKLLYDQLQAKQAEIDQLYDQIPTNEVSGTTINVQDSSNLPLKNVELLGNATQDTSILTYKCVGTETGDYYFVYSSTNYQFTMPTVASGDILTFNTSTKKLYKGTTEITTTTASTGTLITLSNTPNPDYPQDIHVVTGDNTVKVLDKNLFDKDTAETKKYIVYTTGNTGSSNNWSASDFIMVEPSTTYYLSGVTNSGWNAGHAFYDANKTFISAIYSINYSITTPANARYMRISINTETPDNVQLEYGNASTPYKPYTSQSITLPLGNIELAKIGDYTDKLFKAIEGDGIYDSLDSTTKASLTVGKWYKQALVGKKDLSTCSWVTSYNMGGGYRLVATTSISNIKQASVNTELVPAFAEKYIERQASGMSGTAYRYYCSIDTTKFVVHLEININPTGLFYYPQATPTYTEITDTTLISQLENILQMHTNKNVTNAWIEPSGTNAQAGLTLTYRQDLATLIAG